MTNSPCIIVQTSTIGHSSVNYVLTKDEVPDSINDFLTTHQIQILRLNLSHVKHSNIKLVATPNHPGAYRTIINDDNDIHAHKLTNDEIENFHLMLTSASTITRRSF